MSSHAKFQNKSVTPDWVRGHWELILELPEPGQEYRFESIIRHSEEFPTVRDDLPKAFLSAQSELRERNIIERQEYHYNPDLQHGYYLWETAEEVYEYAKDYSERVETYPCDHSAGFVTIDADEGIYECGYRFCSMTHDRETVESVEF